MSKTTGKKKQQVSCCVHDITIFDDILPESLRVLFCKYAKKYTFQQERGEKTGQLHFQCRVSLKQKMRPTELANKLRNEGMQKFNVTVTSNANKDNDFYCQKEETRVEGTQVYTDENFKYIPRDVRAMVELRPWQKRMIDHCLTYNERMIDVVIELIGNVGKTRWTRYMECFYDAETLDFANDYKDIMRMAYDMGPKLVYMIDMPRAISKDKLYQFYGAIETLKSGKCFDDRYHYKKRLFDPPRVIIFCNSEPDLRLLSADMWNLWTIKPSMELVPYVAKTYAQRLKALVMLDDKEYDDTPWEDEESWEEIPEKDELMEDEDFVMLD